MLSFNASISVNKQTSPTTINHHRKPTIWEYIFSGYFRWMFCKWTRNVVLDDYLEKENFNMFGCQLAENNLSINNIYDNSVFKITMHTAW